MLKLADLGLPGFSCRVEGVGSGHSGGNFMVSNVVGLSIHWSEHGDAWL